LKDAGKISCTLRLSFDSVWSNQIPPLSFITQRFVAETKPFLSVTQGGKFAWLKKIIELPTFE